MFCSKCGNEVDPDKKFCPKCGNPIGKASQKAEIKDNLKSAKVKADSVNTGKRLPVKLLPALLIAIFIIAAVLAVFLFRDSIREAFDSRKNVDISEEKELEKDNKSDESNTNDSAEETEEEQGSNADKDSENATASINIRQVENSAFPLVRLYAGIQDESGNTITVSRENLSVSEIGEDGQLHAAEITEIYKVTDSGKAYINLVLDISASMQGERMQKAKDAAVSFLNNVKSGNSVEIIAFNDYVYQEYPYSTDIAGAQNAVNALNTDGDTALYDGLYAAVYDSFYIADGAKCVIGFTDGEENSSSYSLEDVVSLSNNTGIPVYIIGIGSEANEYELRAFAQRCSGEYFYASDENLEEDLKRIYNSIYDEQQNDYVLTYRSINEEGYLSASRRVRLTVDSASGYSGEAYREYVPVTQTAIESNFGIDKEQIIPDSSSRAINDADLDGLSLAELRIARNEIFARHGRMFKDNLLNQWFYSKSWYLQINPKYSPEIFESSNPNPLSKLESDNAKLIIERENYIIENRDIFPDASNRQLSTYDLALTKAVLTKALDQVRGYAETEIRNYNISLIIEAIADATM